MADVPDGAAGDADQAFACRAALAAFALPQSDPGLMRSG